MTKNRYDDKTLKEFETIILSKIEVTNKEISALEHTLKSTNEQFDYFAQADCTLALEQSNAALMIAKLKKYKKCLLDALKRINNKTYGICRKSGILICKKRLRLVPHTTLSIEAKNRRYP